MLSEMLKQDFEVASFKTKEHESSDDLNEIPIINRMTEEFDQSRFSDIKIIGFGKTWNLHKLLLIQSPLLSLKIEEGDDVIFLDCSLWNQLSKAGLHIALRDLYHFQLDRIQYITIDNCFSVLTGACFLELGELARYCYSKILSELSLLNQNVILFTNLIDQMKSNFGSLSLSPGQKYFLMFDVGFWKYIAKN